MSNKKIQFWAAVHCLGSIKMIFSTEKECRAWCKRNSYNPKHPIYISLPLHGVRQEICDKCEGKGSILTPTISSQEI